MGALNFSSGYPQTEVSRHYLRVFIEHNKHGYFTLLPKKYFHCHQARSTSADDHTGRRFPFDGNPPQPEPPPFSCQIEMGQVTSQHYTAIKFAHMLFLRGLKTSASRY